MCFLFVRRSSVRPFFKTQSHSVSAFATDFSGCDSCGLPQSFQSFQVYVYTIWWVRVDKQTQVLRWITESHDHRIAQLLRSTWRSQLLNQFRPFVSLSVRSFQLLASTSSSNFSCNWRIAGDQAAPPPDPSVQNAHARRKVSLAASQSPLVFIISVASDTAPVMLWIVV